ncbi:DUF4393 domain-containing protein [Bacillus sp. FSL L8-0642]|uniref:DUF4393 domain-containing protein n=1 Tax=Bacillus TaxID=1386 RepID=UPI0007DB2E65|nr:DUF4393 domain-containing protein [Bacillus wiedmannii]OAK38978.1 hypothetical protein A6286_06610 [Bacillus wiedmannii]
MDPIVTAALTSFATTVATNSSKAPLEALDNLWYLALGKFNHFVEKKKADRQYALDEYKKSIAEKVLLIDENDLQEPQMSIVGPALEASKYYIEEESLREMFSNIISASMDKNKASHVHHCFVEIIKQLSPEDARNIMFFKENKSQAVVEFRGYVPNNGGYVLSNTNVFHGGSSDIFSGNVNSTSITNLSRLGLISISYDEEFHKTERYDIYRNSTYFQALQRQSDDTMEFKLKGGIARLTPLGASFIDVCL